jgi:anti-sigma factor RsiW
MTMDPMTHPDDARLAALADNEPEARTDAALVAHVGDCTQCSTVVAELRALQTALSELPDLAPSRPLRLLPPVTEPEVPRAGLFRTVRRLAAPALAMGLVLIVVGAVGSAGSLMGGTAGAAPVMGELASGAARAAAGSHEPSPSASGRYSGDTASPASIPGALHGASASPQPSSLEPKSAATPSPTAADLRESRGNLPEQGGSLYPLILLLGTALAVSAAVVMIVGRVRVP